MDLSYLATLTPSSPAPNPFPSENTYRWATVTQISPLRIRLDGDTLELPVTPDTLVSGLSIDQRVWVQFFGRRLIIIGAAAATLPSSSAWVDVPLTDTTNFEAYDVGTAGVDHVPQICLVGPLVFFRGALEVETSAYVDGTTWRPFATVPVGYRPGQAAANDGYIQQWVCQGDSANRWALRVGPDGVAAASRYGPGSSSGGNVLLAFSVSWIKEG